MKEVQDEKTLWTISYALQQTPIMFLGPSYQARIRVAYETGVDGVYLCFIDYGPYGLRGVCVLQEPEIQIYLDLRSTLTIIQQMIDGAIQEYNSSGNWRMRGL